MIRRGFDKNGAKLSYGDLELDRRRRRVTRGSTSIPLTSKEFALLEFLMLRAPEMVSRSEIIDHVWDCQFDSNTNVIEVYVKRLRQKVDQPHPSKLIQTVRGVGYRLGRPEC
jgi:two-component system copper resistance phosphate regulon response regulator CusR